MIRPNSGEILLACGLQPEAGHLRRYLSSCPPLIVTGLGMARSRATLDAYFETQRPSLLLFTGACGQLDPELEMGQVFTPRSWRDPTGKESRVEQWLVSQLTNRGVPVDGVGLTVHRPVLAAAKRRQLFQKTGAGLCDMESAAVLAVAGKWSVPCLATKVISDTADTGLRDFRRDLSPNLRLLANHLEVLIPKLQRILDERR